MTFKLLSKVVVGSRLHNLHNENSDFDYRGIFIHSLKDILSPFQKLKNTHWIEGDEDNTIFELRDFCKMAVQGNPTILEVFYSNIIIDSTKEFNEMKDNRHKFLDSKRIYEASKGYAHNQYNKMNLFEPDARTPKFCVAYLRTLWQTKELLQTGELPVNMSGEFRDYLLEVKYNFNSTMIPELSKRFAQMQVDLADIYAKTHDKFTPDLEWIENFIYTTYKKYDY
jgi:uncharacterized protein